MKEKEDKESYLSLGEVLGDTKLKTWGSAVDRCR